MRYDDPARPSSNGTRLQVSGAPLPCVTLISPDEHGAWLACIHASRGGNRFGYHSAVLLDLRAFSEAWLADPEACLAWYFGYKGPEEASSPPLAPKSAVVLTDLWEET